MGTWSAAILGNDTTAEVYERFIELYNSGYAPSAIAGVVLDEQSENLIYDKTNVWFGVALACWECKVLTKEIHETVRLIIENEEDLNACRELDADEAFLKQRKSNLTKFLAKISQEREKARLIKKAPRQVPSTYLPGMCLAYKNEKGNYVGVYIVESEHFKNKGEVRFCFLNWELESLPDLEMFEKGKLYGVEKLDKEWKTALYSGNTIMLIYEKETKDLFLDVVGNIFTIIGMLRPVYSYKWAANIRAAFMSEKYVEHLIDNLEKMRIETKAKFAVSEISLAELVNIIGMN